MLCTREISGTALLFSTSDFLLHTKINTLLFSFLVVRTSDISDKNILSLLLLFSNLHICRIPLAYM